MVKISIIIPVYNSAKFLTKSLASVCQQTLRDIEIICVNDGSTDDSLAILQQYAASDARIKIINLTENKGAAVARNMAIKSAVGQYLGFVDADDFIDQNFYEKLYDKALKNDADVVKGRMRIFCPQTNSITKDNWIDINHIVKKHQANFCFSFTSAIFKTEIIKENAVEFLEGLIHFEDPYFTIKAALFYQKLEVIDDVLYYYVNNPESASRKKFTINHIDSLVAGASKIMDLLDEHCFDKKHYIIVFNFVLEQILHCCDRADVGDEINIKAVRGLFALLGRCRYQQECVMQYFLQKKKNHKVEVINQLRDRVKNDLQNS